MRGRGGRAIADGDAAAAQHGDRCGAERQHSDERLDHRDPLEEQRVAAAERRAAARRAVGLPEHERAARREEDRPEEEADRDIAPPRYATNSLATIAR